MTMKIFWKKAAAAALALSVFAAPALALEAKVIRDISRADTSEELSKLADSITKDAASHQPVDIEEGTQIAAETSAYLLYIVARQNALLLKAQAEQQGE